MKILEKKWKVRKKNGKLAPYCFITDSIYLSPSLTLLLRSLQFQQLHIYAAACKPKDLKLIIYLPNIVLSYPPSLNQGAPFDPYMIL